MSSENNDVDTNRSRSMLRQVRETFGSIHRNRQRADSKSELPALTLINTKRVSADQVDTRHLSTKSHTKKSAPVSFSHHVSLLNQFKSHITKTRKYHQTTPSACDNETAMNSALSPTIYISESKSTSTSFEVNRDLDLNEPPSEPLINSLTENIDQPLIERQNSLDMLTPDDDTSQASAQTNESNRTSNSNRSNLNKIKDQFNQRARTVLQTSPSLTSIVTNTSDIVYRIELCIERGKDLAIKDFNGTSDPYVKIYYDNKEKHVTSIQYKNLNPIWNERIAFFAYDLNIPIWFYLFDRDRIGRDESMGSISLDLWKLPLDKAYNATLDLDNEKRTDGKTGMLKISITIIPKAADSLDEEMRLLLKQPNRKASLISRQGVTNSTVLTRRTIEVFIIEGRNLATAGGVNKVFNPYVRLKLGTNKKYRTQTIKLTNQPKWHQSFLYDITINELPPLELTVMDDTGGSGDLMAIGICNLTHLDEERTHRIAVDLDDNAGVIDLFVTITGTTPLVDVINDGESSSNLSLDTIPSKLSDEDLEHYKFTSTFRSITPINDVGKIEIKIYQARDLSAKDINGKSDPFCMVELDTTRLRTHTIYKTLDPIWNKSFLIPVQDIHSTLELTIFDEDTNNTTEFIGKVTIPLLAIQNGEKKWFSLKDRKCILPVKGIIEIEATLIYTNLRAILRTFNPRQVQYYQPEEKFRVGAFKQHINRVRNMLKPVMNTVKFIDDCFQWENPLLSFITFIMSMVIVWYWELYMLPCALLLIFAWHAIREYRRGSLGKSFATLGDETVSTVIQPMIVDEDALDSDVNMKEQKRSLMGVIHGIQDTVLEIQGYIDTVASTLERIKNVFNFTVPWLSLLAIIVLTITALILYHIPMRFLILAFLVNKFTKRFRKPKGFIDNNELADFLSRLPSDPELLQYRELKILSPIPTPKKNKRLPTNGK